MPSPLLSFASGSIERAWLLLDCGTEHIYIFKQLMLNDNICNHSNLRIQALFLTASLLSIHINWQCFTARCSQRSDDHNFSTNDPRRRAKYIYLPFNLLPLNMLVKHHNARDAQRIPSITSSTVHTQMQLPQNPPLTPQKRQSV